MSTILGGCCGASNCGCGECGERGERGKRGKRGHRGHDGHDGHDGHTGPTGPTGPTGDTGATGDPGSGLETVAANVVVDTQVPATDPFNPVFVLLAPLSIGIVTLPGEELLVFFSASGGNVSASQTFFRLLVDGVVEKGSTFTVTGGPLSQSTSIVAKTAGLAAGAHTVDIEWATTAGITSINPVTLRNQHHATLLVARE